MVEPIYRKPSKIISLSEAGSVITHPANREMHGFYSGLFEQHGGVPVRSQLDPVPIKNILSNIVLMDVHHDRRVTFRLIGEDMRRRIGRDVVGKEYKELVGTARTDTAVHALNMTVDMPQGFRVDMYDRYPNGHSVTVEALVFPLKPTTDEFKGHVLLTDGEVAKSDPGISDLDDPTVVFAGVKQRDMIDLGYGIDETFRDLIWME